MSPLRLKLYKILHWEYWPAGWVYYPILPFYLFYALKARSLFFFNASNPSIKNGGMAMESKKEIYDLIPERYIPKTLLVRQGAGADEILSITTRAGISFPFVMKPDIGLKGLGVQIINTSAEISGYLQASEGDVLIQEFIQYPHEAGIFFCRIPGEETGKITGIVQKEFLSVTGDGKQTLLQLIKKKPRCHIQLHALNKIYSNRFNTVISKGEKIVLVPYGSHTRGALFTDITKNTNTTLVNTVNNICNNVNGFYFGRMDVMYDNWEDLCVGKNFSVVELNGAGSEPTHIYDPGHSLWFAWKEIIRHWKLLYKVSMINYRNGHPFLTLRDGMHMIKENARLESLLRKR